MGRISSGIGLISGINSKDIIDQLMAIEARPKDMLKVRIDTTNQQKLAITDLMTRLTSLKVSATTLKKTATFEQAAATSSNENVLTATASAGTPQGSYQFQVSRLVTAQQSVTAGFASMDSTVGAGTISIERGGGEVYSETTLSQLNGGAGVRTGAFRLTDRSGRSTVIDIGNAFTLNDVVRRINTNIDVSVRAQVSGNHLVLTDLSGQTLSDLAVTDLGDGHAAADLGIAGSAAGTIVGTDINYLGRTTLLSQLNDGLGVRTASGAPDFTITAGDGSSFSVTLGNATNLGQVIDAINTAAAGKVTASIQGMALRLTDNTGGGAGLSVAAMNSQAAADLGIQTAAPGGTIDGRTLLASINTVMLSTLRGGTGLNLGTVSITNRAGANAVVDFSGSITLQDVIDRINASGISVTARLKQAGNGIELVDASGGTGSLTVADVSSTTAAELGLAGTFTTDTVRGANLQRQWVGHNTLLSTYNGGRGIGSGKFKITNANGVWAEVDLTGGTMVTLGQVIRAINAKNIGVTASINANGDGLLLTDTSGGAGHMKVEDTVGRSATDLNIVGTAAATTIDGSFEKTIAIAADDSLQDVLDAINLPGFAASATVVNDGSGSTPYRVSLSARNTGRAGRFIFDAGTTSLQTTNLVDAQDAAVFYGGAGSQQPILITSSSNQLTGVVKGLTVDLHSVGSGPVTVNVTSRSDNILEELKKFAEGFNGLMDKINELTAFDSQTMKKGLLLGDGTIQQAQDLLYATMQSVVKDAGSYRLLTDIGVRLGEGAKLEVDEDKFNEAWARDPQAVRKLFTLYEAKTDTAPEKKGFGTIIEQKISQLIDPVSGLFTRQNKALDTRTEQFQDRIEQLDKLLEQKRLRLERQFAAMETVLSRMQSQQQALAGFTPVAPMTSAKSA